MSASMLDHPRFPGLHCPLLIMQIAGATPEQPAPMPGPDVAAAMAEVRGVWACIPGSLWKCCCRLFYSQGKKEETCVAISLLVCPRDRAAYHQGDCNVTC